MKLILIFFANCFLGIFLIFLDPILKNLIEKDNYIGIFSITSLIILAWCSSMLFILMSNL